MKRLFLLLVTIIGTTSLFSQTDLKVGTTPGSISPSSVFEAASTTKGMLIPRMTTAQMNAISSPTLGLMVFNTDLNCLHFYFSGWKSQCDPANVGAWSLLGNTGTIAGTNFLGTTDAQALVFKTNGSEGMRLNTSGNLGIGITTPDAGARLNVFGGHIILGSNASSITTFPDSSQKIIIRGDRGDNTDAIKLYSYYESADITHFRINVGDGGSSVNDLFQVGSLHSSSQIWYPWLTTTANGLGIGTISPQYKLDIVGSNPVRLIGLNAGATSDSIVTSNGGVLRRLSIAEIAGASGGWAIDGNTLTGTSTIGSNSAHDVGIETNGTTRLTVTSAGAITQSGTGQVTFTGNVDATNGLDVTTAALTANAGSTLTGTTNINATGASATNIGNSGSSVTIAGTTGVTGATTINTSGTAATSIGNASSTVTVAGTTGVTGATTINTSGAATTNIGTGTSTGTVTVGNTSNTVSIASDDVQLTNLPAGTATTFLTLNGSNQIETQSLPNIVTGTGTATRVAFWSSSSALSSNANLYWDNTNSRLGIGATSPSYKLDIDAMTASAGNPLRLQGLAAGATTDSILTSASGVVRRMSLNSLGWGLTGNSGTTAGTNFVGTTDAQDLVFKTNSAERMRVSSTGIGIGVTVPAYKLDIVGSNPVRLIGLNAGATSDSVVTSNGGILQRLSIAQVVGTSGWLLDGNTLTGTTTIGSNSAHDVGIETNGTTRLTVTSAGAITQSGTGQVTFTGNVDATNGLDVTTAALTANAGSTLTGTTNINATGASATNIGNSGSSVTVAGTTSITGATTINTTGALGTSIGNSGSAVTIAGTTGITGATTINTTGALGTSIGNSGSAVTIAGTTGVTGATTINTSGASTTNIGTGTSTGTVTVGNTSNTVSIASDDVQIANLPAYTAGNTFLTLNGSNQVEARSLSNVVTGTGTATRVAFWSSSSALSSNAALYWDNTNGRLGLNTASPSYKLDIDAMTASAGNPLRLQGLAVGATTDSILTSASGVVRRMSINSMAWGLTGNSGTTAGTNFVGTTDNISLTFKTNSTLAGYLGTSATNNVFMGYNAGATVSSGTTNTLLGATADVTTGTFTNATALGYGASVDASNKIRLGNTSVTLVETYGSFVTVSDKRLKTNISDNAIGLNFIKAVRPVQYELKAQKGVLYDGFIAQEIDAILQKQNIKTFSGLSKPKNDSEHYSVSYATFVVPLVNAVKELDEKNIQLATENEQLKAELEKMKAANLTLKASVDKNSQDIETIKAMLDKKQ